MTRFLAVYFIFSSLASPVFGSELSAQLLKIKDTVSLVAMGQKDEALTVFFGATAKGIKSKTFKEGAGLGNDDPIKQLFITFFREGNRDLSWSLIGVLNKSKPPEPSQLDLLHLIYFSNLDPQIKKTLHRFLYDLDPVGFTNDKDALADLPETTRRGILWGYDQIIAEIFSKIKAEPASPRQQAPLSKNLIPFRQAALLALDKQNTRAIQTLLSVAPHGIKKKTFEEGAKLETQDPFRLLVVAFLADDQIDLQRALEEVLSKSDKPNHRQLDILEQHYHTSYDHRAKGILSGLLTKFDESGFSFTPDEELNMSQTQRSTFIGIGESSVSALREKAYLELDRAKIFQRELFTNSNTESAALRSAKISLSAGCSAVFKSLFGRVGF